MLNMIGIPHANPILRRGGEKGVATAFTLLNILDFGYFDHCI